MLILLASADAFLEGRISPLPHGAPARNIVRNGLVQVSTGAAVVQNSKPYRVWTVAEAKARLSEILRLAEA